MSPHSSGSLPLRSAGRRIAAWSVHALTASGAGVGIATLLALGAGAFRAAALWSLVALAIDSVDGTLARRARVAEVLPGFDGRRLDDIVDYLNYAAVPAVFLAVAGLVSSPWLAVLPALASCYGFSRADAKTDDHFFLGFPSYWNVVAIYLWLIGPGAAWGDVVVVSLSVAVFLPLRFVYPSQMSHMRGITCVFGVVWLGLFGAAIALEDGPERVPLAQLSLAYPAYYTVMSAWLGRWGSRRRRAVAPPSETR